MIQWRPCLLIFKLIGWRILTSTCNGFSHQPSRSIILLTKQSSGRLFSSQPIHHGREWGVRVRQTHLMRQWSEQRHWGAPSQTHSQHCTTLHEQHTQDLVCMPKNMIITSRKSAYEGSHLSN